MQSGKGRTRSDLILELLRQYGKRVRFIGSAFGTDISRSESHILIELHNSPGIHASLLSDRLRLEQSSLSRSLFKLKRRRFLVSEISKEDKRVSILRLSKSGETALARINSAANESLRHVTSHMSSLEMKRLGRYLRLLANSIGAPQLSNSGEESEILLQIRRITRPMGALGEFFFSTPYSLHHWHVLSELEEPQTVQSLSQQLSLSPNSVSGLMKRYEEGKLVSRTESAVDKRSVTLRCTRLGFDVLTQIRSGAAEVFGPAVSGFSAREFADFSYLMSLIAQAKIDPLGNVVGDRYEFLRLMDESELSQARRFVINEYLHRDALHAIPSRIADNEHLCFSLETADGKRGYCELRELSHGQWSMHLFVSQHLSQKLMRSFIAEVLLFLASQATFHCLRVSDELSKLDVFEPLERKAVEGSVVICAQSIRERLSSSFVVDISTS